MKVFCFLAFAVLFIITSCSSQKEFVDLRWKVGTSETISYYTVMGDLDTTKFELDFGEFFHSFSDNETQNVREIFKKLNQSLFESGLVTELTNKGNGVIDIVMKTLPKDSESDEAKENSENLFENFMDVFSEGVLLRGSVYASGEIHSFWLKSQQRNLISILFELPSHPVKIGDSWSLDVNLITNDHSFICEHALKRNTVTLEDITEIDGEQIALIKYDIEEYVKGVFNSPDMFGFGEKSKSETMMQITHQAIGEFSINRGRWLSYNGIMTIKASGVMKADVKTNISLSLQ